MKTELISIIDESGSMAGMRKQVVDGYNEFLSEHAKQPGEARVTTVMFSGPPRTLDAGAPVASAIRLTDFNYTPAGMTALFDALGRTLDSEGRRIAAEKWADLVIVCVITDGAENASKEYTQARVKEMVGHAEACGWKFVYLGANQDSFSTARSIGTQSGLVSDYSGTAAGMSGALRGQTIATMSMRSGQSYDNVALSVDVAKATAAAQRATTKTP